MMPTEAELDTARVLIYREFLNTHRELYRTDMREYFSQQRRFVERELLKHKYPEMNSNRRNCIAPCSS